MEGKKILNRETEVVVIKTVNNPVEVAANPINDDIYTINNTRSISKYRKDGEYKNRKKDTVRL